MILAEDLLLLLTDDQSGRALVNTSHLDVALGGAQLLDLALAGRVDLDDRSRLVVLDAAPTGDPLLDGALTIVAHREGKKPKAAIGELGKRLRPLLLDRLVTAGVLRAEHGKVLGIFPTTRWPAASVEHETVVRRGVEGPLVQGLTPDPRSASLISLLHALRATHKVVDPSVHGLRRRDLDRRAKEVAEGNWGSAAVRQVIDAMNAAVMAAVTASTVAASSSG